MLFLLGDMLIFVDILLFVYIYVVYEGGFDFFVYFVIWNWISLVKD